MRLAALFLPLLCAASARAADLVPVFDASLLLGQVYQGGKASSWQGNASVQATPAVKLDDRWGLIPTYAASYTGTKSVTDLGSGGQLFQDSMSHSLQLKGIYKREAFKLKPSLGYRWEFLRETKDESWGKGLFDYRKPSAGLESEYSFDERTRGSVAFDYYAIDFHNYVSLESGQAQNGIGREQADGHALNSRNLSWTGTLSCPLPFDGGSAKLTLNTTSRFYPEQHVVLESGGLSSQHRTDGIRSAQGTLFYGRKFHRRLAALLSFGIGLTRYRSDQNHYDAELNLFDRDYYSYDERSLNPRLTLLLGEKKVEVSASYLRIQRDYTGRLAQDAAGTYTRSAVALDQESYLIDIALPLSGGFKLVAHTALTDSSSNQLYEKTYKYNYSLSSHLIGVSYSY